MAGLQLRGSRKPHSSRLSSLLRSGLTVQYLNVLSESRRAAIHMLADNQSEIARRFLSRTVVKDGLINGEPFTTGKLSVPILKNISSYIECEVRRIIDSGGDHSLVVMEVIEVEHSGEINPLLVIDSPWTYGG